MYHTTVCGENLTLLGLESVNVLLGEGCVALAVPGWSWKASFYQHFIWSWQEH